MYNAETVDPNVLDSEFASGKDGILEVLTQGRELNSSLSCRDVLSCGVGKRCLFAPSVAESDIGVEWYLIYQVRVTRCIADIKFGPPCGN